MIELLESRIAPASVVHVTDANGDVITFKSSLGALATSGPGQNITNQGLLNDGKHDEFLVNLSDPSFEGTNLTVTVAKGPHGDGVIANLLIGTTGDLGNVSVAGDVGSIEATGASPIPAIKSLTVNSLGRFEGVGTGLETSVIAGSVGKLVVKGNVDGTYFDVSGDIGSISIGGSLLCGGNGLESDGDLYATGNIGTVSIKHDVRGGMGSDSGIIGAAVDLGAVSVGGSVYGGGGEYSGSLGAGTNVTSVAVAGSVVGGGGEYSGNLYGGNSADGMVGKVTIGDSLVGGAGGFSGVVGFTNGGTFKVSLTSVTIGRDIVGGSGIGAGGVYAAGGTLGALSLKGSVIGGDVAGATGYIEADLGGGAISIGGSVYGGSQGDSGLVLLGGDTAKVEIGGSLYGGGGQDSASIYCSGTIGVLHVSGDVIGGMGMQSGTIYAMAATTETIGGIVLPGTGTNSGTVDV